MPVADTTDTGRFPFTEHSLLMALLDKVPVSIYFKDGQGRFVLTSRGLYERLGCAGLEDVVGKTDRDFFDRVHADKAAADEAQILDGLTDTIDCVEQEVWSNGRTAWVSTVKLPLHGEDGRIVGTFGVSMDVTTQKRTEAALRIARDEAEAVGAELEATLEDLIATQSQLVQAQKLEAIGQLAAGVAHEINTPIQYVSDNAGFIADAVAIVGDAYATARRVIEEARELGIASDAIAEYDRVNAEHDLVGLLEELPQAASESLEGTAHIAEIVKALKAFAHPGTGEKDTVDLNEVVNAAVVVTRNEWKYVAHVDKDLDPKLPAIPAYRSQLQQVLLVLLVNAAQAIAEMGAETKGRIVVGTRAVDDTAEIWVEDSGPGIPESLTHKIFDPFFTTKDVGVGTGQGLAIAHNIVVDRHGGDISFENIPNQGTRFLVRLPITPRK